jgi:hypothetical protein
MEPNYRRAKTGYHVEFLSRKANGDQPSNKGYELEARYKAKRNITTDDLCLPRPCNIGGEWYAEVIRCFKVAVVDWENEVDSRGCGWSGNHTRAWGERENLDLVFG